MYFLACKTDSRCFCQIGVLTYPQRSCTVSQARLIFGCFLLQLFPKKDQSPEARLWIIAAMPSTSHALSICVLSTVYTKEYDPVAYLANGATSHSRHGHILCEIPTEIATNATVMTATSVEAALLRPARSVRSLTLFGIDIIAARCCKSAAARGSRDIDRHGFFFHGAQYQRGSKVSRQQTFHSHG